MKNVLVICAMAAVLLAGGYGKLRSRVNGPSQTTVQTPSR